MNDRNFPSVGVGFAFMVGAVIGWVAAPRLGFAQDQEAISAALGVAFEGCARFAQLTAAMISRVQARVRDRERLRKWEHYLNAKLQADPNSWLAGAYNHLRDQRQQGLLNEHEYFDAIRSLMMRALGGGRSPQSGSQQNIA